MIRDMAFYMVLIFTVAASMFAIYMVLDEINTAWQTAPGVPMVAKTASADFHTRAPMAMDYFLLTGLLGVFAFVLLLVWFIDINPIFFFVMLIVVAVLAGIAGYFSNAWEMMSQDANISAAISNFPITNFIMSNYLVIIGVFGFVAAIVFLAKPGGVQ